MARDRGGDLRELRDVENLRVHPLGNASAPAADRTHGACPIRCVVCFVPLHDGERVVTDNTDVAHFKCVAKVYGKAEAYQVADHPLNVTVTDAEYKVFLSEEKS